MTKFEKELLAAHRAIIDRWFAKWLRRERARISANFARQQQNTVGE